MRLLVDSSPARIVSRSSTVIARLRESTFGPLSDGEVVRDRLADAGDRLAINGDADER